MKREIMNFLKRNKKNLISAVKGENKVELKKEEDKGKWQEKNHPQENPQKQKNQEGLLDR